MRLSPGILWVLNEGVHADWSMGELGKAPTAWLKDIEEVLTSIMDSTQN